ncbi:uncharacterized protein LOC123194857 isoform X3 [Mangifera indica]|uniref:uncharacterized protein LOC123194857 isoform X3 n=1 Tax=Mangifera indica TaxID=29780 RepID=UPI001CFB33D5|nr:uncharacterized protein LOC123194857 isoform X3 [Mangifera indica]XP_044464262.1 uncharacterized protein LOC123194857 isoform X3 [Mangifera indica]XP_044464263.1 uncharacterized protein LOC123194857 isoform X3 [Mangifera indica]
MQYDNYLLTRLSLQSNKQQVLHFGNSGAIIAVMRFKKGDKVEVLSQKEVPSGSWRCAEIICGNGHNYTVRYDGYSSANDKKFLDRVSRKSIRPCPPILEVSEFWVPGDVVEVFDIISWKMATISKVLRKRFFLVRLLGSSLEFKIKECHIRVRQSWQDDKWVVIGEGSGSWENGKHERNSTLYCRTSGYQVKKAKIRMDLHVNDDLFPVKNSVNVHESHVASSKTLKRGSPCFLSQVEGDTGAAEKLRRIDKHGRLHRVVAANPCSLIEAVAFPREMLGEIYIHPSCNDGMMGISDFEAERKKSTGAVGCSLAVNFDSNDAHSVTSSVGSCSIDSNTSYKLPCHVSAGAIEDSDGNFSDAESSCQLRHEEGNCLLPTKEELAVEIHRLELHAYRSTMEALYASGPLSWEQEALGQGWRACTPLFPMSQNELGPPVGLKYLCG